MRAAVVLVAFLLAGCESANGVDDPLEPVNREVFAFNQKLDHHAALPAASYYKAAVPGGMREGVHNFFSNLTIPVTFANDILQGEMTQAGYAVCRLGVNTTIGVLGVMDRATEWGCPENDEDFGQTLAVYGVPGGPYLVLPFLGSTLPRDLAGRILVDHYFNPLGYVTYHGKLYVSMSENLIKLVDQRSRSINALRDVERTSVDYYAAMRSIYLQKRDTAIHNGPVAPETPNP
jgi:phospholipid-binding lipoprotein MlaA